MRRHATASAAGSILRRATVIGRFFPGAPSSAPTRGVKGSRAALPVRKRVALASFAATLASLVAATALLAGAAVPATAAGCPNEAIRAEQGEAAAALADCRAYELVSEPESAPYEEERGRAASVSGERFTYATYNPFSGQTNETLNYVVIRGPEGWKTYVPVPGQNGAKTSDLIACSPSFTVTPEIDHVLLVDGIRSLATNTETEGEECLGDEPPLAPGEPRGVANIFRGDATGSSYELVDQTPEGAEEKDAFLGAFTPQADVVAFTDEAALTPDAPPLSEEEGGREERLYLWAGGAVHYAAYLPDGSPTEALLANGRAYLGTRLHPDIANVTHAISDDGESLVFEHASKIYLRVHALRAQSAVSGGECTEPAKACTLPVDVSEEGPSEIDGFGSRRRYTRAFEYMSADGSRIFFMDDRRLTPDSTAVLPTKNEYGEYVNGKADLYEFDVATGETSDLTVDPSEPANVRGFAGASEDGSYLYFAAYGDLTGSQQNSQGDSAVAGRANLYLLHGGALAFIGTLVGDEASGTGGESYIWQEKPEEGSALISQRGQNEGELAGRVSANGKYFAFPTTAQLTGFDNTPAEPEDCFGGGCRELFLYEADSSELSCVSCSPSDEAPVGDASVGFTTVPSLYSGLAGPEYMQRNVSNDGKVFFNTPNPLLSSDVNGEEDVYEYDAGQLSPISSGRGSGSSSFIDASADGRNVFFNTGQGLVHRDGDNGNSVYDARVDGGFAEPPALPGCEGEACRGAGSSGASPGAAGSSRFNGPGNRVGVHRRNCSLVSAKARRLSRMAKLLRRRARRAQGPRAVQLAGKSRRFAKKSHRLSRRSKRCRRLNRRAGK